MIPSQSRFAIFENSGNSWFPHKNLLRLIRVAETRKQKSFETHVQKRKPRANNFSSNHGILKGGAGEKGGEIVKMEKVKGEGG